MKAINHFVVLVFLLTSICSLESCSSSEPLEESEEQIFVKKMEGTWKTAVVTYDGVDVTKSFPGLTLSILDKSIRVENPMPPIWKSTSSFTLNPVGNTFEAERNDGLLMNVTFQSPQKMVFIFIRCIFANRKSGGCSG